MNKISVKMFKEFILTIDGREYAFDKMATKKMCSLLQMLIYHKNGISKVELVDELWQDVSNPSNSLKHAIFRLRAILDEIPNLHGENVIETIKNGYKISNNFIIEADYTRMDECFACLQDKKITKKEMIGYAEEILALYSGPFFMIEYANWSIQVQAFYHNIYEKAFRIVCDEYIENEREQDVLPILEKAIKMDEFYDDAYVYYMRVYIKRKEYHKAMDLYQHINDLYERELGHEPSMYLKSMYRMITNQNENVIDIKSLKKRLNANSNDTEALCCDYHTFQYIYKVALNNARRGNKEMFLLLFQLNSKESDKRQEHHVQKLKNILCSCLRSGDVLSKINRTQIIALLPCESIDNGYTIIQRITSLFYKNVSEEKYRIHYFISPIFNFNEDVSEI